jgi:uncharacterized Fe-S radical SAM superfamily protein PflX
MVSDYPRDFRPAPRETARMHDYEPSYLTLHGSGELRDRAQRALALLEDRCRVCPRLCKVDRLHDQPGLCRRGRAPQPPRDEAPSRRPRAGRARDRAARLAHPAPRHAGLLDETEAILRFVATELGPGTYVNVMAQYYPAGRTSEFPEIDRHLYRSEFERALELGDELGLRRLDERSRAAVTRLAAA